MDIVMAKKDGGILHITAAKVGVLKVRTAQSGDLDDRLKPI